MSASLQSPRVRFAPSPTGELHIGGLRTALFDWLLAKKYGGSFILRIEDTDQTRYVEGAEERLLETLTALGLVFDESPVAGGPYGPYRQSERLDMYQKHMEQLVSEGKAYYCTCTPERLEKMRAAQMEQKQAPRYDQHCRDRYAQKPAEAHVIRFRMPQGVTVTEDYLRGALQVQNGTLDDFVLLKADGFPTYHSAVVIDDHAMEISHVLRGDEWLPSLPKHILLYQAFGWKAPVFVHLPLILGKDKKKLSKRHGASSVELFLSDGITGDALLNFVALLGWHASDDKEIYSREELIQAFSLDGLQKSSAVFDMAKLHWMNAQYLKAMPPQELARLASPYVDKALATHYVQRLPEAVTMVQERIARLSELPERLDFLRDNLWYDPALLRFKNQTRDEVVAVLSQEQDWLNAYDGEWSITALEKYFHEQLAAIGKKPGEYFWPLRVALTGKKASPGTFEVLHFFGKSEGLRRIAQAIALVLKS